MGAGREGAQRRSRLCWSATLFVLMLSCLGLVIPMAGLGADGDYEGFVTFAPCPPWLANGALLAVALVNGYLLWRMMPQLVQLKGRLAGGPGSLGQVGGSRPRTSLEKGDEARG